MAPSEDFLSLGDNYSFRINFAGPVVAGATLAKGTNAKPLIEITPAAGFAPSANEGGITVGFRNTTINGLVINHFPNLMPGIEVSLLVSRRLVNGVKIQGNFLCTDPSGTVDEGNEGPGINLVESIDGEGPNANDAGDADAGPNRLQNKPVLTSAKTISGATTVKGTLNSRPTETYTVQFFSSPSDNQGRTFVGSKRVKTDRSGKASFTFSPASKVAVGQRATATATRTKTGDTSEFSAARTVASS